MNKNIIFSSAHFEICLDALSLPRYSCHFLHFFNIENRGLAQIDKIKKGKGRFVTLKNFFWQSVRVGFKSGAFTDQVPILWTKEWWAWVGRGLNAEVDS